jgi:hypothetical protein
MCLTDSVRRPFWIFLFKKRFTSGAELVLRDMRSTRSNQIHTAFGSEGRHRTWCIKIRLLNDLIQKTIDLIHSLRNFEVQL